MKKVIVISGINIFEGGPLTVFNDCLKNLAENFTSNYRIIALVHRKQLFNIRNIFYIELPKSRISYLNRIFYEYFYFNKISKRIDVFLWFSMHDITPRVKAKHRIVYCHNPTPFFYSNLKNLFLEPTTTLFSFFYKYLYKINIKKNDFVIVQQDWIREQFVRMYNLRKENVIVAIPSNKITNKIQSYKHEVHAKTLFFYPAFPRIFKNFEVICDAVEIAEKNNLSDFEVVLTINGTETRYSNYIVRRYQKLKRIHFVGLLSLEEVIKFYKKADCLIFPSRLETWGLPISEFKSTKKPMIIADLPYAHETVGTYDKVIFFDPMDAHNLYLIMKGFIRQTIRFEKHVKKDIEAPCHLTWNDLFISILG